MIWAVGIGGVLFLVVWVATLKHRRWLDEQSPVGVWVSEVYGTKVTLQFEGGPHEGTYKQLSESADGAQREFGHWAARRNKLQMLVMASERKDHPRFGEDSPYTIRYVRPDAILIDGPDLSSAQFEQGPEGARLEFGEESLG